MIAAVRTEVDALRALFGQPEDGGPVEPAEPAAAPTAAAPLNFPIGDEVDAARANEILAELSRFTALDEAAKHWIRATYGDTRECAVWPVIRDQAARHFDVKSAVIRATAAWGVGRLGAIKQKNRSAS